MVFPPSPTKSMHTTCFHKKLDDPMAGDLCPGDICPGNICPSLSSIRIADISWPKFQVMILGPFRFNFDQNTMDQIFLKFFFNENHYSNQIYFMKTLWFEKKGAAIFSDIPILAHRFFFNNCLKIYGTMYAVKNEENTLQ